MSDYPFKLFDNTANKVVLKVIAGSSIDISRFPYVQSTYDFITVTKGEEHTLTVIKHNGTTFSFDWGRSGYTLISSNTERLRTAVCQFIQESGIALDVKSVNKPYSATVMYNKSLGKWQARLKYDNGSIQNYYSSSAKSFKDVFREVSAVFAVEFVSRIQGIAQTGITVWECDLEGIPPLQVSISDWYVYKYPTDEVGYELSNNATFAGLLDCLENGKDVYAYLDDNRGYADSVVRERCFDKLADILKVSYEEIYDKWLANEKKQKNTPTDISNKVVEILNEYINRDVSELGISDTIKRLVDVGADKQTLLLMGFDEIDIDYQINDKQLNDITDEMFSTI